MGIYFKKRYKQKFPHVAKKLYLCTQKPLHNMAKLNIIRPPKVSADARKDFWKQIGMIVLGATISLMLTIVAAQMLEKMQRAKDRKLSAMMVLSNIEMFSRALDEHAEVMASVDSVATWLLSKPIEELELLPEDELNDLIDRATGTFFITYDKTTEQIFSKNIETWKNMGNVRFIDMVGQCFSAMKQIEEYWNNRMTDANAALLEIKSHPDNYEGSSIPIKVISNDEIRRTLKSHHYMKAWLGYTSATMRYYNRQNMKAIGISAKKVMEYTDKRDLKPDSEEAVPNQQDFSTEPLAPENLTTFAPIDAQLDSLMGR